MSGARRLRRTAWLCLAPALAWMLLWLGLPLVEALAASFSGAGGWGRLLEGGEFARSLGFTLSFSFVSVGLEMLAGLALGLALARRLPLAWLWRSCLLAPWAVPSVVSAKAWAWLFNYQFGLVNLLLVRSGLASQPVNWFAYRSTAWAALLCVELWKTVPLVAILLLAGRQQIPQSLYEAAALDGASAWKAFRDVTLPLLRPYLVVAGLFRMVDALRIFDSVWVLTGGGPAGSTQSLSYYAYTLYFHDSNFVAGSRVSLVSALLILALAGLIAWRGRFGADLKEGG